MNDTNYSALPPTLVLEDEPAIHRPGYGIRARGVWLVGPLVSLVFLIYPVQVAFSAGLPLPQLLLTMCGVIGFAWGFLWLMWTRNPFPIVLAETPDRWQRRGMILFLCVLVMGLNWGLGFGWRGLLFHVNVAAGLMLVRRDAYIALVGLAISLLVLGLNTGEVWFVLPTAALGLWATAFASQVATVAELQAARQELARRAVFEERLRFARDLHDLLGHSLSLITLKNELAGRLLQADPQRAAQEIREAEQVARRALREVREAVAGYRQPTLDQELYAAEEILKVAGIACRIERNVDPLPPAVESMLAWVVREGTTNVVRHSRAHHCTIHLLCEEGIIIAEIRDDGRGSVPASDVHAATTGGLAGLAERIAHFAGATLVTDSPSEGGFRLQVRLPLTTADRQAKGAP